MNWNKLFRKIEKKYPELKTRKTPKGEIVTFCLPDVKHVVMSTVINLNKKKVITVIPDMFLYKNEILSCSECKAPIESLLDYQFYDKNSYKAICKHLDRILLKRKDLLIQKRMNEMDKDFNSTV
jgi:hypothetical protein